MSAAELLLVSLRQPPMRDLAGFYKLRHYSGNFLDRNIRIGAVLIIQIDMIGAEPLQRCVCGFPYRFGARVGNKRLVDLGRIHIEFYSEFCRYYHLAANIFERFSDKRFVLMRIVGCSVNLRCIEEIISRFNRAAYRFNGGFLIGRSAVSMGKTHTAKTYRGYFQVCA